MKELDLAAGPDFRSHPSYGSHDERCDCIDWACNDDGDGGVCTHCGELHTVTIRNDVGRLGLPMSSLAEYIRTLIDE